MNKEDLLKLQTYLTTHTKAYTKTLYNELGGKKILNISLNKFRDELFKLRDEDYIVYDTSNYYPVWKIRV